MGRFIVIRILIPIISIFIKPDSTAIFGLRAMMWFFLSNLPKLFKFYLTIDG